MASLQQFERDGVSVSRIEERHGWLGRVQRDPADVSPRGWFDDPQPRDDEQDDA